MPRHDQSQGRALHRIEEADAMDSRDTEDHLDPGGDEALHDRGGAIRRALLPHAHAGAAVSRPWSSLMRVISASDNGAASITATASANSCCVMAPLSTLATAGWLSG